MNNTVRPIFNKNFAKKWILWVLWTVHEIHWCALYTKEKSTITTNKKKKNVKTQTWEAQNALPKRTLKHKNLHIRKNYYQYRIDYKLPEVAWELWAVSTLAEESRQLPVGYFLSYKKQSLLAILSNTSWINMNPRKKRKNWMICSNQPPREAIISLHMN